MKGGKNMKYLKIEKSKGCFLKNDNKTYETLDKIKKEDILYLLDCIIDNKINFEMDEYIKENISNEAHAIIYEKLFKKFSELLEQREQFADESSSLYKEAFQKYQV